tara:strand:- start:1164 stop:2204 length:1041 start_codon:yes stop_codon:yes gene_type:complete
MNPAFAGFESADKLLIHHRRQWLSYNNEFNTYVFEANLSAPISKARLGSAGPKRWTGGMYIIADQENPIIKCFEFGFVPWTMHFPFQKEWWLSLGVTMAMHHNTLDWGKLIFSDQINDYNSNEIPTSANLPYHEERKILFDPSFGFVVTKKDERNKRRWVFGMAFNHLSEPMLSWYNNNNEGSKIDLKYTIHAEKKSSFSNKEWKMVYRHQRQGSNIVQRDDLGTTIMLKNRSVNKRINRFETGLFGRIARYNSNNTVKPIILQSVVPLIRWSSRIGRTNVVMETSYSYDFTNGLDVNGGREDPDGEDFLKTRYTSHTHEFSLKFIFTKNRPASCPGEFSDAWMDW